MTTRGLLTVFTEGDRTRGLGHVSRCSAYAQGWVLRGGQVSWVLDADEAAISVVGEGHKIVRRRWQEDGAAALDPRPAVALVDSYSASGAALEAIAAASNRTVFIDDLNRTYPAAGIVVHPSPDRTGLSSAEGAVWLEGPKWQPLRPAFSDLPQRGQARPDIGRVLVVFGGGDLRAMGVAMARLVADLYPSGQIDLVLGAGQPEPDAMANLSVHRSLDAGQMAALMQSADIAISAAGQTVFELARCGTPAVLVGIADNQQPNLDHWPDLCGYVSAGRWDAEGVEDRVRAGVVALADPAVRQIIGERAATTVDGQGVRRLFDHLDGVGAREPA